MCWQQRYIKRMLAFSTISHTGLFVAAVALLTADGTAGGAVYVAGRGCAKAALFALTGVLLDRHGSVDEHGLHGRARDSKLVGVLFVLGALALAGLPPFGTGPGKSLSEDASGHGYGWLVAVHVTAPAVTGNSWPNAEVGVVLPSVRNPQRNPHANGPRVFRKR